MKKISFETYHKFRNNIIYVYMLFKRTCGFNIIVEYFN
jgi:hypothetical protein